MTSSDTISLGIFSSLCEIGIFRRDSLTCDISMRGLFSDDGVAIQLFLALSPFHYLFEM